MGLMKSVDGAAVALGFTGVIVVSLVVSRHSDARRSWLYSGLGGAVAAPAPAAPAECVDNMGAQWCLEGVDPSQWPYNGSGPAAPAEALQKLAETLPSSDDDMSLHPLKFVGDNAMMARSLCRPGLTQKPASRPLFVEVGAFDGMDAVWAARHGCRVLSIEASPPNYRRSKNTVSKQVSAIRGHITLRLAAAVSAEDHRKGGGHILVSARGTTTDFVGATAEGAQTERVETVVLAELLREEPHVTILKVDVEGADIQVLEGAMPMLNPQRVKALAFEFSPLRVARLAGNSFPWSRVKSVFEGLRSVGYTIHRSEAHGPFRKYHKMPRAPHQLPNVCRAALASGPATHGFGAFYDVLAINRQSLGQVGRKGPLGSAARRGGSGRYGSSRGGKGQSSNNAPGRRPSWRPRT